jgi:hypothetical protein
MSAFSAAVDAIFADANMAVAAVYTPPGGGAAVPCRVMRNRRDQEFSAIEVGRPISSGDVIDVRASEVTPLGGGAFTIGAETLTIVSDPVTLDPDRLIWTCNVK